MSAITEKISIFDILEEDAPVTASWRKQVVIFQRTNKDYLAVTFWNDKIDSISNFNIGDTVILKYFVSSKEVSGRWFTNLNGLSVEETTEKMPENTPNKATKQRSNTPPPATTNTTTGNEISTNFIESDYDDLFN